VRLCKIPKIKKLSLRNNVKLLHGHKKTVRFKRQQTYFIITCFLHDKGISILIFFTHCTMYVSLFFYFNSNSKIKTALHSNFY
jgi:hypothetical protein